MAQIGETQEIVDLIIDHLVNIILHTDMKTRRAYPASIQLYELKQCALINKAFASRSQKHLFSTIRIRSGWVPQFFMIPETERTSPNPEPTLHKHSYRAIDDLLEIFDRKPYLASHMHTIDVSGEVGYLVKRYSSLRKFLELLRSQGMPLKMIFCATHSYEERRAQPDYQILQIIGPNLQHINLRFAMAVPVEFIANNLYLKSLELVWCSAAESEHEGVFIPPKALTLPRPRLKSLTLDGSWTLLDILMDEYKPGHPAVDFSDLNDLHLVPTPSEKGLLSVRQLLSIAGPSLKIITMSAFAHDGCSYQQALDLSSCHKLHTAKLITAIYQDYDDSGPFDRFIDTLNTIPCPNSINYLDIEVYLPVDSRAWRQRHLLLRWDAMDRELGRIASSPSILSHQLICNLHIRFNRNYTLAGAEIYKAAIVECEEFAQDLKDHRFPVTTSNEHVIFKIIATLDVESMS